MPLATQNNQPVSLYIHIPWCVSKCPYCDFNSHKQDTSFDETGYIKALIDDLENDVSWVAHRPLKSIFVGGGTPSLFSAQAYEKLFSAIAKYWPDFAQREITMEVNPNSAEAGKFKALREIGINRLSIGIQSFDAASLDRIGRAHSPLEAHRAIEMAQEAGFERINIDLMYGLPKQTIKMALEDISQAITHDCTHLSWYHLTIEPNTWFYRHRPPVPNEAITADIEQEGLSAILKSGHQAYEVSAYAIGANQCEHNLNYWGYGDYLGIGAGSHSKLTLSHPHKIFRQSKVKRPQTYLDPSKAYTHEKQSIDAKTAGFEFMLNALRLIRPILWSEFEQQTGLNRTMLTSAIKKATVADLLKVDDQQFEKTRLGQRFLNDLVGYFL